MHNPAEVERFEADLKRYLNRKIGLEAVMRVRCTKGTFLISNAMTSCALLILACVPIKYPILMALLVLKTTEKFNLTKLFQSIVLFSLPNNLATGRYVKLKSK